MTKTILAALFVGGIACGTIHAQTINTIAGIGTAGFSGDGGAATSAEFNTPTDVAIGPNGDIYIADRLNYRVRKIDGSGIISTVAGTGTAGYNGDSIAATTAEINNVWSIAVDNTGNLYLADADNHRIRVIDTFGIIHTVAGNGTAGYSGDGGLAISAEINKPVAVTTDGSGNIFISDLGAFCVRKVSAVGIISTVAGTGNEGFSGDGGPATSAELSRVAGIAIDNAGNLYISDNNSRIRKVNASGIINTVAGNGLGNYNGDNIPAASASLNGAVGVCVDASGNYYIVDAGHFRIRIVTANDTINTIAGTGISGFSGDGGAPTLARINCGQIAVTNNGAIYIADAGNNRIRNIGLPTFAKNINPGNNLKLFPNSNNGSFALSGNINTNKTTVQIEVFDITGKVIMKDNCPVQNGRINKQVKLNESTPAGQYLLRVSTENGSASLKFEKR